MSLSMTRPTRVVLIIEPTQLEALFVKFRYMYPHLPIDIASSVNTVFYTLPHALDGDSYAVDTMVEQEIHSLEEDGVPITSIPTSELYRVYDTALQVATTQLRLSNIQYIHDITGRQLTDIHTVNLRLLRLTYE